MIVICVIETLLFFNVCINRKEHYSAITYIWMGITFPLILYLLRWSDLIDEKIEWMFIYIFICFTITSGFYAVITKGLKPSRLKKEDVIVITSSGKSLIPLANLLFIFFYLLESKIGTGYLIPSLHQYDDHTLSVRFISYFTRSLFAVVAADFYAYKATKKKRYIICMLFVLLMPVLTRYSRMSTFMDTVRLVSLFLFIDSQNVIEKAKDRLRKKRVRRIVIVITGIIMIAFIAFTNYRMSSFGKYDLIYSESIRYTGPKWLSFFAPYYGYFPLSFNNLNINLRRAVNHNFLGLYSFASLTFGILHLHTMLGISTNGHISGRYVTSNSATVPTGFWDFYYDYDILCFIPMIVAFMICYWILKKASREKSRLTFRTLYSWYIPTWLMMSFQNVLFGSTLLVTGVIIIFLINKCFVIKKTTISGY